MNKYVSMGVGGLLLLATGFGLGRLSKTVPEQTQPDFRIEYYDIVGTLEVDQSLLDNYGFEDARDLFKLDLMKVYAELLRPEYKDESDILRFRQLHEFMNMYDRLDGKILKEELPDVEEDKLM